MQSSALARNRYTGPSSDPIPGLDPADIERVRASDAARIADDRALRARLVKAGVLIPESPERPDRRGSWVSARWPRGTFPLTGPTRPPSAEPIPESKLAGFLGVDCAHTPLAPERPQRGPLELPIGLWDDPDARDFGGRVRR
jgi:hypothetical protein